ncbi:MAG: carbohydrate ABC transporter permease [Defluviitaleaceae bacterium]|nr:carbohydrate ABC transporter permease [Defluviitaleaceae bacterium]MCL2276056.1 carbohydrate ABC transporter permease [Defluviitaleaceae bacterium]
MIRRLRGGVSILLMGFFALLFAMPIVITFTNSFMTGFEIQSRYAMQVMPANYFYRLDIWDNIHFVRMALIPPWVTLGQYLSLLFDLSYLTALWNSIIITVPAVIGTLVVSLPAAYAFEVSAWRHKEKLFFIYLVVMLMPLPVILVPQFVMAGYLGIQESVLAVILPAIFSPFGVFLLRQFMKTFPTECLEAATIDGAGNFRMLISIVLPLIKPAVAALAMLTFVDYWNVVDQAIVFITNPAMMPLSVQLSRIGSFEIVFAASFFYMLPALIVFLWGQEHLVAGMRLSGLR